MQPWTLDSVENIGHALTLTAERLPDSVAVACPAKNQPKQLPSGSKFQYDTITFAQLEYKSNQIARGIMEMGMARGSRVALMVPPGIDFVANVFGLFKAGVVIILIDPGMGRKNMVQCLAESKPLGMVGVRLAQVARTIYRSKFPKCKKNVSVGGFFLAANHSPGFISFRRILVSSVCRGRKKPRSFSRPAVPGHPKAFCIGIGIFCSSASRFVTTFKLLPVALTFLDFLCSLCLTPRWERRLFFPRWTQRGRPKSILPTSSMR